MTGTDGGRQALERELRGAAPRGVAALDSDALHDLASAVADARRRQAAEIAAAGERALSHLPALLRVAVRKVAG